MKIKTIIWLFFGLFSITGIAFSITPLRFNNEDYAFATIAISIILFSIFLVFNFQKRIHKIIFPFLVFISLSILLVVYSMSNLFCGDYGGFDSSVDQYIVRHGAIGCWAGPSTGSYDQLERKIIGDIVTWVIERKEVNFSEIEFKDTPTFLCSFHFVKSEITIDICQKKVIK